MTWADDGRLASVLTLLLRSTPRWVNTRTKNPARPWLAFRAGPQRLLTHPSSRSHAQVGDSGAGAKNDDLKWN